MSRVLIVEDDTITRSILARVAGTLPGVTALAVSSVQEARAALEVARPDVAIIDLHLEDGLGFEVLKALDEAGGVAMAIIISAHLAQHERALSASPGRLRCMAKPLDHDALKRTLAAVLSAAPVFHGPFAPIEYIQIAGTGRHDVNLCCYDPAGAVLGSVLMRGGRVWSADTPESLGMPALRELVAGLEVRVRLEAPAGTPAPGNIDRDWHLAVLDALEPRRGRDVAASDARLGQRPHQLQRAVKE